MPVSTCVRCGSHIQCADSLLDLCAGCSATAIVKPEDAHQVKVTLPSANNQVYSQRRPVQDCYPPHSANDDASNVHSLPSILREYHYSLLRICVYTVIGVAVLFGFFALLLMAS